MKNKILVILGPTATGKTDLAIDLAKKFNGEVVACDSRQVYKGLDIGTGKSPGRLTLNSEQLIVQKGSGYWEIDGTKIWMYDLLSPAGKYDVSRYILVASKKIKEILEKGKLPIIVGGTGLYLKALLYGLSVSIPENKSLRKKLEKYSLEKLQQELIALSPIVLEKMNDSDKKNKRRLIRKVEILSSNNQVTNQVSLGLASSYQIFQLGLNAPKEYLDQRIDKRVLEWLKDGIVDEVEKLIKNGLSLKRLKELGLEYSLLADFHSKKIITQEDLINLMQIKTRQYAKRQLTWFKKEPNIVWIDITTDNYMEKVVKLASNWYNKQ